MMEHTLRRPESDLPTEKLECAGVRQSHTPSRDGMGKFPFAKKKNALTWRVDSRRVQVHFSLRSGAILG